jgi:hypothetical protein
MSRNSRRERQTLAPEEVTMVDEFVPDYESTCENCRASPTVLGMRGGNVVFASHKCGPCTWGDSDCIDPDQW